jgi:alkylated DNA repair dioxygenase AlkB
LLRWSQLSTSRTRKWNKRQINDCIDEKGYFLISDLLSGAGGSETWSERLGPGAIVLRGFATAQAANIVAEIQQIIAQAPFRHMETPGGFRMSVAMSNCGEIGLGERQGRLPLSGGRSR